MQNQNIKQQTKAPKPVAIQNPVMNFLNNLEKSANKVTGDKKILNTLDIRGDGKFWHKNKPYQMQDIYIYTRKNTSLYFVKCEKIMFIFDRIKGLINPRKEYNEEDVLKLLASYGMGEYKTLKEYTEKTGEEGVDYLKYAKDEVMKNIYDPSSKSGADLPGCIDILYEYSENSIHIKYIKGKGNPEPCDFGEYSVNNRIQNEEKRHLQVFEKLFGKLFGILHTLKFEGQIKLEDDSMKNGRKMAPLRMIVGRTPSIYTKYGFKYVDNEEVTRKIENIQAEVKQLTKNCRLNENKQNFKLDFESAQKLIDQNPGLKSLVEEVYDLPMILDFPTDNKYFKKNEMGGGRKSRKTIKKIKKTKKVRKHQGIIQTGGNIGRLRKGYRYSGKKLKSGLPQIIKCKSKKC